MSDLQSDMALVERLRSGDESAFEKVFVENHAMLVRLARVFVKSPSIAEEIAQDTWVAVIAALGTFESRSTLKTWIARIAINRAKTRAVRDKRNVALDDDSELGEASVDSSRFYSWGGFKGAPERWDDTPEALLGRREVRAAIEDAIETLPAPLRAVVTLRDIEGWSSEEVCNALELSESNQRVLLHRARSRLRAALEVALKVNKP